MCVSPLLEISNRILDTTGIDVMIKASKRETDRGISQCSVLPQIISSLLPLHFSAYCKSLPLATDCAGCPFSQIEKRVTCLGLLLQ